MRETLKRQLVTTFVGLLLAVSGAGPAASQEGAEDQVRVGLEYEPGFLPALVMPSARGEDGALAPVAARVDSILRTDLDYSDRFEMMPVPDSVDRTSGVRYGLWNELGALWLVTADLTGAAGSPLLRVALHDVVYGRLENVQAFSLPAPGEEGFRMAVHRVSDALIEWATGTPGMAATRISFRRKEGDGVSDVWIVDSDGRNLRRVTRDSSIVYSPALSPDGRRLLYVSYVEGRPAVYERDLRTGETRVVSDGPGLNITPTYRPPDGQRLALARDAGGSTEIFELQSDPLCCARRITFTSPGDAVGPSYAPDGDRFAFTGTPLGEPQVYVQRVSGGGTGLISRYVYGERGQAASPDWSPTGERIAYQAWIDGTFQVVTVNPDGTDRRILTDRGSNEEPSWAPDGRHLVFRSDRAGYHALWVLDTVTGRLRRLTSNHVDQMPDWSERIPAAGGGS